MPKNLYIGDMHLGHENILYLDNRPFQDVRQMDEALIANWNKAVSDGDTVYVLGDMFWRKSGPEAKDIMDRLPGRKILIRGDHDRDESATEPLFNEVHDCLTVKDGDTSVFLSHYPSIAFPGWYGGGAHLYAHVHDSYDARLAERVKYEAENLYQKACRMYNTGCMMPWMGYTPRTLSEIETNYAKCRLNAQFGAHVPRTETMLTLSTGHVSSDTAEMLRQEPELNCMGLAIYEKSCEGGESYGWYIYLPPDITDHKIPCDLKRAMSRAASLGCQILCLDSDGYEDPSLQTYEW